MVNGNNNVTVMSNSGAFLSGPNGYTGGGLGTPLAIAMDGSGKAWIANSEPGVNSVTEISSTGTFLSGPNGYTGGGLNFPGAIAVDGSGNVWVINENTMTEMVGIGTPVITPIAAGLPVIPTKDGTSNLGTRP